MIDFLQTSHVQMSCPISVIVVRCRAVASELWQRNRRHMPRRHWDPNFPATASPNAGSGTRFGIRTVEDPQSLRVADEGFWVSAVIANVRMGFLHRTLPSAVRLASEVSVGRRGSRPVSEHTRPRLSGPDFGRAMSADIPLVAIRGGPMRKSISLVFVAALAFAACGGSDDGSSSMTAESSPITEAEAESATAEKDVGPVATEAATSKADAKVEESATASSASELAPSDEEALLKQAAEEYVVAFGEGDPDAAVSLLSERCTDTIPLAQYRAAVAAAGDLYPGLVVDDFYDIVLDEDRAVVYYTTDPEVETEDGERWIIESGAWVWDDC